MKPRTIILEVFFAALLLSPSLGFGLRIDPSRIEVGDTGSIAIPFENQAGGVSPIENIRVVVASVPAWVEMDTAASYLGPVTISTGELTGFNFDYEIGPSYNPLLPSGLIILQLLSDSTSFVPSGITWSFSTDNGFKTMRGECVDNDGIACGSYISPDTLAPNTYLQFDGPSYEAAASKIFLSTSTLVYFVGSDAYESNAEIARSSVTGYSVGAAPASFENLNFSTEPITLSAGSNSLYFASRDYAGNTEVVKSSVVYVDALAPTVGYEIVGSSGVGANGVVILGTASLVNLIGFESGSGDLVSGMNRVMYSLDVEYSSSTAVFFGEPFALAMGAHTIYYTAFDNVENQSEVKTLNVVVGNTNVACGSVVTENTILASDLDCSGITDTAVTIGADNITFDGGGHRIIAPNAARAIGGGGRKNLTIKNFDLSGSGTGSGIEMGGIQDSVVENITASGRVYGMIFRYANRNLLLRNNNASGNVVGIAVAGTTITLTGNTVADNARGMDLYDGSAFFVPSGNDFSGSTIALSLFQIRDTVFEDLVLDNSTAIELNSSRDLVFRNLNLSGYGYGKGIDGQKTKDIHVENVVARNRDIGIRSYYGGGNSVFVNNDVSGSRVGIYVGGATMTVTGNNLAGNGTGTGLAVEDGVGAVIEGNTATDHDYGIVFYGAVGTIRNNNLAGNKTALMLGGSTITVSANILANSETGLFAEKSFGLVLTADNDFSGSTTAVRFNYGGNTTFENLRLNNQTPIIGGGNYGMTFRNLDLSGTGSGNGLELGGIRDSVIENVTAHGRVYGVILRYDNFGLVVRDNDLSGNIVGLGVSGSTIVVSRNDLRNNDTAFSASDGGNLNIYPDNNFQGSTVAISLLNMADSDLSGFVLDNPKAIVLDASKRIALHDMDLSGAVGTRAGRGLRIHNSKNVTVKDLAVHNREVGIEGRWYNSELLLHNNDLSGNKYALIVGGSTITITGNSLRDSDYGLFMDSARNINLPADNDYAGSGTAISLGYCSDIVIEGLTLANNVAIDSSENQGVIFRNLDLSGNVGSRVGRGLKINRSKDILVENVTAKNREVGIEGRWYNSNVVFRNNDVSGSKHTLIVSGSTMTVTGNKMRDGEIGLYAHEGRNLVVSPDNDFSGSETAMVFWLMTDTLLENLAIGNANGILMDASRNIVLRNLDLSGPNGGREGYGINMNASEDIEIAGVLAANKDVGVKILGNSSNVAMVNNTLTANNSGIVLSPYVTGAVIANSILWGNSDDVKDDSGSLLISYSNVGEALLPGTGNSRVNPRFNDVASGDFGLNPWSDCVDAGTNDAVGLPGTDLLGKPRIFDGNGDGVSAVDMGAYESQVSASSPVIAGVSPSSGAAGGVFAVAGTGFGEYLPGISKVLVSTYSAGIVSWTNGAIAATVPMWLIPGEYPVIVETESGGVLVRDTFAGFIVLSLENPSADGGASIVTPGIEISVAPISTGTITSSMTVYTAMLTAGLEPVQGAFYEFEPSGVQFAVPATLKFAFDPVGVDTTTLAIYYFDGMTWSSTTILNQRVVFESDTLAYLEGEITHTSIYALLRKKTDAGPVVSVALSPATLNLDSHGGFITAELGFTSGSGCFRPETIMISAVNGAALAEPIYAQKPGHGRKKGGYELLCGTATVKFDRDEVGAVLPANAVSEVTVSGQLESGAAFRASDEIRTIKHFRGWRGSKWRFAHRCGAFLDGKAGALKNDLDLFMLKVERGLAWKEARKERAATAAGFRRHGSAFEFGPEGLKFEAPVTISLPYDPGEKNPERLLVVYWNEAAGSWEPLPSRHDRVARLIKADVAHFSQYQVVAATYAASTAEPAGLFRPREEEESLSETAAAQEFRLGEVYVYPDPAKGGKVPTFHIEVGAADTVKIRVYTVAGQLAHERTFTGAPQSVGGGYAYEYPWEGRIASGVYYYTIEAEKAGRKLKTRGKFGVIR